MKDFVFYVMFFYQKKKSMLLETLIFGSRMYATDGKALGASWLRKMLDIVNM